MALERVEYGYGSFFLHSFERVPMEKFASEAELCAFLARSSDLKSLCIADVPDLVELPVLPAGVETLWIADCPRLERIGQLPSGLRRLSLRDCAQLQQLPCGLADLTEWFCITRCLALKHLPPLPSTLEWFEVKSCGLEAIPDLERCMQMDRLLLQNCPDIVHWSAELPPLLEFLVVENCGVLPLLWQEALSQYWPGVFGDSWFNDDSRDPQNPYEVTNCTRSASRERFKLRAEAERLAVEAHDVIRWGAQRLDDAVAQDHRSGRLG